MAHKVEVLESSEKHSSEGVWFAANSPITWVNYITHKIRDRQQSDLEFPTREHEKQISNSLVIVMNRPETPIPATKAAKPIGGWYAIRGLAVWGKNRAIFWDV
ncbi:hypothetical protein Fot_32260 [Forsythia ovata]|uniref:Uncharacterized protein n=1 Tax=Forsythia ovata TaxID=205694 RepID=A0ABD1T7R3_9LAMI